MPQERIDPALVPTISAGNIFDRFTEDSTLNVRWITVLDPVLFEVQNRPMVDITIRQLIMAKAIDALQLRLSHQSLFPFLVPCKVDAGTTEIETPASWIWDMHVSLPAKWEYLRLAQIQRLDGSNGSTGGTGTGTVSGTLRLIFSAQEENSSTEVSMFYVDYEIDSSFLYQIARITPATTVQALNPIDTSEAETINGFIIFRTLDQTDATNYAFLTYLAPASSGVATYEIVATPGSSGTDYFIATSLSHGTGIVVASAFNAIPALNSDVNTWLRSMNYPFRVGATRTSQGGIVIPAAIWNEFQMIAPTFDEETGDVSKTNSPVWISAIERLDSLAASLKFYFSTHTIVDDSSVPQEVEFTTLTLDRTMVSGQVVNFKPIANLLDETGANLQSFMQGFGTGHVTLSSLWGTTSEQINDFFDSFLGVVADPAKTYFVKESAILSSFGLSRNSRYVPTRGQSLALAGTGARLTPAQHPSDDNRFVNEADQGLGNTVDFRTLAGFPDTLRENPDIGPIAHTGALTHRVVSLIVDTDGTNHDYDRDILPRLTCLLGRAPQFGDYWWQGTNLCFYTGDSWITL